MSASGRNVKLEFVGGPSDGAIHVVRQAPFAVGAYEGAEVPCTGERLLSGEDHLLFEFDDAGNLSVRSTVEMEVDGEATYFAERLREGAIVRVGATEVLVAEIGAGGGAKSTATPKKKAAAKGPEAAPAATVKCRNPECGEVNEAGRVWCKKCGRDL